MRPLVWSRMQTRVLNAKIGIVTVGTVGLHTDTGKFVASTKFPGTRSVHCDTEEGAKMQVQLMYSQFMRFINGSNDGPGC